MIERLNEPASNWLVLFGFGLIFILMWSKDKLDGKRFAYLAKASNPSS